MVLLHDALNLFEYANTGSTNSSFVYGTYIIGQIYTIGTVKPNVVQTVYKIKLNLDTYGSPSGTITLKLRNVTNGIPADGATQTGTLDVQDVIAGGVGWYDFLMDKNYKFYSKNSEMVITLEFPNGSMVNGVYWIRGATGNYDGGYKVYSSDNGVTWASDTGLDSNFSIYGYKVLSGGQGTRIIKTDYPHETGLIAETTKQEGRITKLVPESGSLVNRNWKRGL